MLRSIIQTALMALVALWPATGMEAQPHRPHPAFTLIQELKDELQLSPEQEAQLKELEAETSAQRQAIHTGSYASEEERHSALRAASHAHKEELKAILTPEQQQILREKRREQREAHAQVDHKAMRQELHAYREKEILPVLRALRARLEAEIDPADQAAIAQLRQLMEQKKAALAAQHNPPHTRESKHEQRDQWRQAHSAELDQLKALVNKYDAAMSALLEEVKPQHEQWMAAEQAIRSKYLPSQGAASVPPPHPMHHRERMNFRKHHFLLLSPEASAPATISPSAAAAAVPQVQGAQVSPNPANSQASLQFSSAISQEISIEIRNDSGVSVRKLGSEPYEAGTHKLDIDLSGLAAGLYYCVVTEASGAQQLLKLMVVK